MAPATVPAARALTASTLPWPSCSRSETRSNVVKRIADLVLCRNTYWRLQTIVARRDRSVGHVYQYHSEVRIPFIHPSLLQTLSKPREGRQASNKRRDVPAVATGSNQEKKREGMSRRWKSWMADWSYATTTRLVLSVDSVALLSGRITLGCGREQFRTLMGEYKRDTHRGTETRSVLVCARGSYRGRANVSHGGRPTYRPSIPLCRRVWVAQ